MKKIITRTYEINGKDYSVDVYETVVQTILGDASAFYVYIDGVMYATTNDSADIDNAIERALKSAARR